MSDLFSEIYGGDALSEPEKQRLKAIANGIQRQRKLSAVATMSSDEGLRSVGRVLGVNAESDSDRAANRFADEISAETQRRKDLLTAAQRAEDLAFRDRQQADLQEYRRQSLVNAGLARARSGAITPYQQAQLDLQNRKLDAASQAKAEAARAQKLAKLSGNLASTGLAELDASVNAVNSTLGKYAGKDIPGVGGLSNMPLVGRFAAGEEGRTVRSQIAAVRNALLKARSGGAVTESEAARMEEELGTMLGGTDETLRSTWPSFVSRYNAQLGNVLAPYQDVLPQYRENNPRFKGYVDPSGISLAPGAGVQPNRTKLGDY